MRRRMRRRLKRRPARIWPDHNRRDVSLWQEPVPYGSRTPYSLEGPAALPYM